MYKKILYIFAFSLLTACSASDTELNNNEQSRNTDADIIGKPVCFLVGDDGYSRASNIDALPEDSRFVCNMFYPSYNTQSSESVVYDLEKKQTAWMKVSITDDINKTGNATYTQNTLTWQNRRYHAFVALADYNQLKAIPSEYIIPKEEIVYDLTRGEKTKMEEQPDPILAFTKLIPQTAEDKVNLLFKHQFSQIQVNIFNDDADQSVSIVPGNIANVELVGVSTEGHVFTQIDETGTLAATTGNTIGLESESAFSMFLMPTPEANAVSSFNAIAFGTLNAIRITWYESADPALQTDSNRHIVTYKLSTDENSADGSERILQSGTKYIYNITLRRGSIGMFHAQIEDWDLDETEYTSSGSIVY